MDKRRVPYMILSFLWVTSGNMNPTSEASSREASRLVCLLLTIVTCLCGRTEAAPIGADAVVLVNSSSATYFDFRNYVQPYLDNFGVPYVVQDIVTNAPDTNLSRFALVIVGHSQIDTNQTYLTPAAQSAIAAAVSNGVGLVNFDANLFAAGGVARYQFVQDLFAFTSVSNGTGGNVTFTATEPGLQMHFVASRHINGEIVSLRSNITVTGVSVPTNAAVVASSGSRPLVVVRKAGQGRVVQWLNYDWISMSVLGPIGGLDDLVWRGMVWAARKPFVIRGLPNFVTMRVDDCEGPFWWLPIANEYGFKPWIGPFLSPVDPTNAAALRYYVTNGIATSSPHAFCGFDLIYRNRSANADWPDDVMSNKMFIAYQWYQTNAIPISKVVIAHYAEIGANAFKWFQEWGVEYVAALNDPGTSSDSPWLAIGPYRKYGPRQAGTVPLALYYADFFPIPGHPEFNHQFFSCVTEIRDDASCGEWCPYNNVFDSAARGTRQLKRAMDSMALATLYTHEISIQPITCTPSSQFITTNNWRAILAAITNNIAAYKPTYVTLDYACQYIRATRTGRLLSSSYDPSTGRLDARLTGYADIPTVAHIYLGQDNSISNIFGEIPVFAESLNVTLANFAPVIAPATMPPGSNFRLSLHGLSNFNYRIDVSTNLLNWDSLTSLPAINGVLQIDDPNSTNLVKRFYRAVWLP